MTNNKKTYIFGDMLPGGRLSEEDWQKLKKLEESLKDAPKEEYNEKIFGLLKEYYLKYRDDGKEYTCLLCGKTAKGTRPDYDYKYPDLCITCFKALYYRSSLPRCGITRPMKNSTLICRSCGERAAQTMGLCRRCYHHSQKSGITDTEPLRAYIATRSKRNRKNK